MNIRFANQVAAAAAIGLLASACGESTPEPTTPTSAGGGDTTGDAAEATEAAGSEGGEQAACCKGMNECKGKGGCKTDVNECAGKNECKGKGGCNMHCPASGG